MTWVSDAAIARLRTLDDRPDFAGTRYEIFEEIGRGGMGLVFRGRDHALDREVAIKVTAWSTAADADRLRREARTLAALEHPGIVPVHDVGQLADGRVYSVMMLVRGERLDVTARPLSLSDRLRLFDRICDTVSFAHARNVVHRDLKPANIMVGRFGQVLLLDWGLATPGSDPTTSGSDPAASGSDPTASGSDPTASGSDPAASGSDPTTSGSDPGRIAAGGTEGYMAPEQRAGFADARTDVYALGAILQGLIGAADAGSRSTRPLASIVARAMGSDPGSRYPEVAALAADVRRFVDGAAVGAHTETLVERTQRLGWTYRTPIALVLAYLAMRLLLLLWRG